ncbi:MAG: acetyl-CoA acetyltransferase, partial [Candidatus Binatia bacterium]
MNEDRIPIIVGAAQLTQKDVDPAAALEPLAMMAETSRLAAADAGATEALLARADCVGVVNILGHDYGNAPRALAERVGASPTTELYTAIGGNSPQFLVNEVAARIADGRVGLALLSGAEALATAARARRGRIDLAWTPASDGPRPETIGADKPGTNAHESTHGLQMPIQVYPLFENALRARTGRSPETHLGALGELYAGFSRIAADNPYAWFRSPRTAEEISMVTPSNRMIGFPYPKLMNAIMDVDQAASLVMTSVATARALGIPEDSWVYLLGAADAHDHWY